MTVAKNVFTKGVVSGADVLIHPNDALFDATNADFSSTDGNLFAVARQKGNTFRGQIPNGYVPVVTASNKGVAYIFSIELNGKVPTGRAQIGCYPSPNWKVKGSQQFLNVYSPLMNYGGDTQQFPLLNGPFTSRNFNILSGSDFEMELQNDYDGSVNIIINDGKNPTWIINSGFAMSEGNYGTLIEREGKSTNRYHEDNFKNTLRLILNSTKIMNVKFNGVQNGGKLRAGNYRYFFYYMTNDGSLTQMINESMDVHVFEGNSPSDIKGDDATGKETNKFVSFSLSNLDASFPFVKVFFTYSYGASEALKFSFELSNPIRFGSTSVEFIHTGLEHQNGISPDFLNKRIGSIESIGSITQIQGHLFGANIKERGRNIKQYRKFAAKTKTGSKQIKMDIFGTEQNLSGVALGKTGASIVGDAYAGGYYNPLNTYKYLGYFGRETYAFGIVFIYKDGSVTPAFPVLGVDNQDGNKDLLLSNITDWQVDQMIKDGGYMASNNDLVNTNGIYRFPKREVNPGLLLDPMDHTKAMINGVTFQLPDINNAEFSDLKEDTIGFFFVRGERKPDLISQGYLIDTVTVPSIDLGSPNEPFECMAQYRAGYSPITSKFVPAYDFTLEAVKQYETYGSGSNRKRSNYKGGGGIIPYKFNFRNRDFALREKFAFISAEVIGEKDKTLQVLSSKNVAIHMLGKVVSEYDFPTQSALSTGVDHFSIIRTNFFERSVQTLQGKANWVIGGSGLRNNEGFSAGLFVNTRLERGKDIDYLHFPLKFNDYVGITIPAKLSLGDTGQIIGSNDGQTLRGLLNRQRKAAALVNIYDNGGPRTTDNIKSIYTSVVNETYQQISPRFYWNDTIEGADPELTVQANQDANGKISCFGGDCFVNPTFRKIFFNQYEDQTSPTDDTNENSKCNVGYTLGLVTESHLNSAIRSEEVADINEEGRRTFVPYGVDSNDPGDKFGEKNPLRKSRLVESAILNKGYKAVHSLRNYFTVSDDNSYVGSDWFARIIVSPKYSPNSFDNAYRNLSGINFQDYNPELGKIVRILNYQGQLLAVYENGVITIPVNQRIQTGSDAGGSIFIEAHGVLPPAANPISIGIGSKWHDSIINVSSMIMGIDSDKDILWSIKGGELIESSRMRYDSKIEQLLASYKNRKKSVFENIVANRFGKIITWSFLGKPNGDKAIGFDLYLDGFIGNVDYIAISGFELPGRSYAFDSQELYNKFYEQFSTDSRYSNYFGKDFPFKISFVVNQESDMEKVFDNLEIISNNILPDQIIYKTQGTKTVQKINFDPARRRLSNAAYKINKVEVAIPPVGQVTNEDVYDFIDAMRANARSMIRKKSRQKGHAILIELIYKGYGLVKINSVLTTFRKLQ
jgi:hypothetical protein